MVTCAVSASEPEPIAPTIYCIKRASGLNSTEYRTILKMGLETCYIYQLDVSAPK